MNIKITCFLLLLNFFAHAQGDTTALKEKPILFDAKFSFFAPNPSGEHFMNNAADVSTANELQALFFIKNIALGFKFQYFDADISRPDLAGDFDKLRNRYFAFVLGYKYQLSDKFYLQAVAAFGGVSHRNTKNSSIDIIRFKDTGESLYLGASINYKVIKNIALFAELGYRRDFMDIKTSPELDKFFNRVQYIPMQVGVRFLLY
ncbi:MAG: hypothetical protein RQ756_08530 [Flavobacteriaceae bacterium]|nr:hypothetical protein [Flavobacteriaceae bacterium]